MNNPYIRMLFKPILKNPVLVAGLPSVGNVGVNVTRFLAESSNAELFAELYAPTLPDYVNVRDGGLCSLPKYDFLASKLEANLMILIGETQPPIEDLSSYYEICGSILDFIKDFNCSFIVTLDGFPSTFIQKDVYVAGTSDKIALEYASLGAKVYSKKRIVGLSGLLLGMAKLHGIEGICLLSPVTNLVSDQEAALNIYEFLRKALGYAISTYSFG